MMKESILSKQQMISILDGEYNIKAISADRLPLGADMAAEVYKVHDDRNAYFVKIKHGNIDDIGIQVVKLLLEAGITQVIPPIRNTSKNYVYTGDEYTLIVYPYVDGSDGFSCPLTDDQWIRFGQTMREIHDVQVPNSLQQSMRQQDFYPLSQAKVKKWLSEINSTQGLDAVGNSFCTFITNNIQTINNVLTLADTLSKKVQLSSAKHVLCHSDVHAGNVLVDKEGGFYILDWDAPIMAPRERDLMFIGAGVGNVWNKFREVDLFYQGYGAVALDLGIIQYYRVLRIIEDIYEYISVLWVEPTGNIVNREQCLQQFIDMFAPNGVIDIATHAENYEDSK